MFRCRLLCNSYAGEGAQQAVQGIGISLTSFGQETNIASLVSQCIGNSKANGRAKPYGCGNTPLPSLRALHSASHYRCRRWVEP